MLVAAHGSESGADAAAKTFPQNRGFPSAITTALATLLGGTVKIQSGQVLFLTRG